jgi:sporulation protein YlmC with PRC-barrel domain
MASQTSSHRSTTNVEGPTILWTMLKGKKVKSNDGKDIGKIKEVSQNFLRLEKGTLKKGQVLDSKIRC